MLGGRCADAGCAVSRRARLKVIHVERCDAAEEVVAGHDVLFPRAGAGQVDHLPALRQPRVPLQHAGRRQEVAVVEDGRCELWRVPPRLDKSDVEELAAVEFAAVIRLLDHHHDERAGRRAGESGQVAEERAQLRRAVLLGLRAEGND